MPAAAVALVAIAAVFHASWNLITKRTGGGIAFLWLFGVVGTVAILPAALVEVARMDRPLNRDDLVAVLGTGFIHVFYFSLLQGGYRSGDLSVVYPVARGLGPLLTAMVGISILGDRPGPLAITGGLALLGGVVGMSGLSRDRLRLDRSIVFGLLTGVSIAAYTLWDRRAVATLEIPPVFYFWGMTAAYTAMITPAAVRAPRLPWDRRFLREKWKPAVAVALMSAASYSLVLTAMTMAPLSYVATLREASILIATILGVKFLGETLTRRKAVAALAIVAGVIGLTLG